MINVDIICKYRLLNVSTIQEGELDDGSKKLEKKSLAKSTGVIYLNFLAFLIYSEAFFLDTAYV
ncbi:hypothetical protein HCUR_01108 [Holospora curviuscula]|uniref:Uncharacterized protein n=1 Tax=Holospora curviuscula TaxID=1082868 RepID=A0A2S5R835_9PROT|nr:hypothetical protein HCUR_01108 [Holospora curviuscula]